MADLVFPPDRTDENLVGEDTPIDGFRSNSPSGADSLSPLGTVSVDLESVSSPLPSDRISSPKRDFSHTHTLSRNGRLFDLGGYSTSTVELTRSALIS